MTSTRYLGTTRRRFLALCAAVAGASLIPTQLRLAALRSMAIAAFQFTAHERAVLKAAANAVAPGTDITRVKVNTRLGSKAVPSAGNAGAVDYIELLLAGTMIFAAGTRRPPYVKLPAGALPPGETTAPLFPSGGSNPLWTVKAMGWFGDSHLRPTRPYTWPKGGLAEIPRLQKLYQDGVKALDRAAAPLTFDKAPFAVQTALLETLYAVEVSGYNVNPLSRDPRQGAEGNQPFFLTLIDHVCEACFGDPVYGGNKDYVYWDMINFTGPSYIAAGGPAPGQGWSWRDMLGPFDRDKTVTQ